jgi:hypothetical protein
LRRPRNETNNKIDKVNLIAKLIEGSKRGRGNIAVDTQANPSRVKETPTTTSARDIGTTHVYQKSGKDRDITEDKYWDAQCSGVLCLKQTSTSTPGLPVVDQMEAEQRTPSNKQRRYTYCKPIFGVSNSWLTKTYQAAPALIIQHLQARNGFRFGQERGETTTNEPFSRSNLPQPITIERSLGT